MIKCVMCHNEFSEKELDFLGRCENCFRKYLTMEEKPNLGIPFTPVSKAVK
jgi:DNA-directed RNA polymerase subunit RPC12/RpoP